MRRAALAFCLVSSFVAVVLAPPAGATFSGGNGRIAFYL